MNYVFDKIKTKYFILYHWKWLVETFPIIFIGIQILCSREADWDSPIIRLCVNIFIYRRGMPSQVCMWMHLVMVQNNSTSVLLSLEKVALNFFYWELQKVCTWAKRPRCTCLLCSHIWHWSSCNNRWQGKIRDDMKPMGYLKAIFSTLYIIVISYAVYSLLMRKILDNQYGQKEKVYKSFNLISCWSGKLGLDTRI